MRTAFIDALVEAAALNDKIWFLTGDLGFSVIETFADRFPDRFINVGVAEQNMVGIAAGLAMTGKTVFTYSIANFSTLRCLEQIRNDVCYHNLPVITVAVGGGLAYGSLGYSHHAVEDLGIMRTLPNLNVVAPGDPLETRAAVKALIRLNAPGYLRIGKANEPTFHATEPVIEPGCPIVARPGTDLTLLTTGGTLFLALEAAELLSAQGFEAEVLSLPFVVPLTCDQVSQLATRTGRLLTIEEHGPGGLGAAIGEKLCQSGVRAQLRTVSLTGNNTGVAGSQEFLRGVHGLTTTRILEEAKRLLG